MTGLLNTIRAVFSSDPRIDQLQKDVAELAEAGKKAQELFQGIKVSLEARDAELDLCKKKIIKLKTDQLLDKQKTLHTLSELVRSQKRELSLLEDAERAEAAAADTVFSKVVYVATLFWYSTRVESSFKKEIENLRKLLKPNEEEFQRVLRECEQLRREVQPPISKKPEV